MKNVYLSVGEGEGRHLGSHLDGVLLLLQTHLPLLLLLLQTLDGQLPLHLKVFLKCKTNVSKGLTFSYLLVAGFGAWFSFNDLLLLPHDLQLLRELDLPLPLRLLRGATQLLPVLVPQSVEGGASVAHLSQFILQSLVVHCQQQTQ